jgi:uncharacterized protein (DUF433 family)
MDLTHIIHSDPEILGGTPVFVGTRVPVDTLLVYLKRGETLEEFLDNFPTVSRAQAVAFLEDAGSMSEATRVFRSDHEIADRLKSYWEQYMKVVDLTITLATGSFLVLANIVFSDKIMQRVQHSGLRIKVEGLLAAIFLGSAILFATAWRMLSLTWMEIECIGSRDEATAYLRRIGVVEARMYAFQAGPSRWKRRAWVWSKYATGVCIVSSWVLLLVFGVSLLL